MGNRERSYISHKAEEVADDLNIDEEDTLFALLACDHRGEDGIKLLKDLISKWENELEDQSQRRMERYAEERMNAG